jgi:hypothetical protein
MHAILFTHFDIQVHVGEIIKYDTILNDLE